MTTRGDHPGVLAKLKRRFEALVLASNDMASVAATSDHLLEIGPLALDLRVVRTVETGLVVTYARPFVTSRGLPKLTPASFNERFRRIHDAWIDQRHSVYAHNDDTGYRLLLGPEDGEWMVAVLSGSVDQIFETWSPPTPDMLMDISWMASTNRSHFAGQIEKLIDRIRERAS